MESFINTAAFLRPIPESPLNVQPEANEPDGKFVFQLGKLVFEKHSGNNTIIGRMSGLHYGKYCGRHAALIIFQFVFQYPPHGRDRARRAIIRVTFKGNENLVVCQVFPIRIFGASSLESHENTFQAQAGLAGNTALPDTPNVTLQQNYRRSFTTDERVVILGIIQDADTVARWDLSENKVQKKGIPHEFSCGAIVEHWGNCFIANVTVGVGVGLLLRLRKVTSGVIDFEPVDEVPFQCKIKGMDERQIDFSHLTEELTDYYEHEVFKTLAWLMVRVNGSMTVVMWVSYPKVLMDNCIGGRTVMSAGVGEPGPPHEGCRVDLSDFSSAK
jgi:hypothetical protein